MSLEDMSMLKWAKTSGSSSLNKKQDGHPSSERKDRIEEDESKEMGDIEMSFVDIDVPLNDIEAH
jgi:hypothetical protein